MNITIHCKNSGKRIRVIDRIGGREPLNDFLNPDEERLIGVASNDGQSGDIDVTAQMRADSAWVAVVTDYGIRVNETLDVDDV